jgi:hypothetical protein
MQELFVNVRLQIMLKSDIAAQVAADAAQGAAERAATDRSTRLGYLQALFRRQKNKDCLIHILT